MRRVLLLLGCLGTMGCQDPPSQVVNDIQYLYDARTDLCFATRYGGLGANSFAMVAIPCSSTVIAIARGGK
jgi:hypothetical protein